MAFIFKFGFLISFLAFIWILMEYLLGFHDARLVEYHPYFTLFSLLIPIFLLQRALQTRENLMGNAFNFADAMKTGVLISIITGFFNLIFQTIYQKIINPTYLEFMIDYAVSHKYAPNREKAAEYFNFNAYLIQGFIAAIIGGIIISLIITVILIRKKKNG